MSGRQPTYAQKLKDPRWQKVRLLVLERDNWCCTVCGDSESTLFVHHGYYVAGKEPWEYPLECFHACCEPCHQSADAIREELKVLVGSMSVDMQCTLIDALTSLRGMSYGEMMCGLSALRFPSCVEKLLEQFSYESSLRQLKHGDLVSGSHEAR